MAGIFDMLNSAFTPSAPGAMTRTPTEQNSDAYNASMLSKGMVRDPQGNWIKRPSTPVAASPTAVPSAPAMPKPMALSSMNPAGYAMTVADKSENGG